MGSVDPALVVVRLVVFGLAILLFGGAAFDLYAPDPPRRHTLPYRVAAPLALAAAALGYVGLLAREAAGGAPDAATLGAIYTTGFGLALGAAQAAAALLALLACSARDRRRARLVLAGCALAALAFVGHAAGDSGPRGALRLGVLALHLLAIGAWLGALPRLRQALGRRAPAPLALVRRFARIGGASVAVVVATGLMSFAFVAADARGALGLAYLEAFGVKLGFVVALLGLAAFNRLVLTPALARDPDRARRALRVTILLEQALGLGALASVALLGQLDPM
jgi:putative copper export protein